MNWVVTGLAPNVTEVVFTLLDDVTRRAGFAENATDPKVEGDGKTDDYAFDELQDLRQKTVAVVNGKATAAFWAKDYGAQATLKVQAKVGQNQPILIQQLTIPLDSDKDGIADAWERRQVSDWNRQLGKTEVFKPAFFGPDDDKELPDPDGPNTDGGADMPSHKEAGDNLTVSEEYRGYVLDGGKGATDHGGGHARMSPVFKELLVEVDRMTGVNRIADAAAVKSIMNKVAGGFSDPTNGAGIRMYWLLDNFNAGPRVDQFVDAGQGGTTQNEWTRQNFNATLPKRTDATGKTIYAFVYLAFSNSRAQLPAGHAYGSTGTTGSHVFVAPTAAYSDAHLGLTLNDGLATVAAHELTHIMLNGVGAEDLTNPNGVGQPGDPDDQTYLMYESLSAANWGLFKFDNLTRSNIGLTDKEFTRV